LAETYLVFAAEVSERGVPLDCRIVVSSQNERMDRAVCGQIRSRARFEPALDSMGRPVHAQYVNRVHWETETH
jgi:protein TonB